LKNIYYFFRYLLDDKNQLAHQTRRNTIASINNTQARFPVYICDSSESPKTNLRFESKNKNNAVDMINESPTYIIP